MSIAIIPVLALLAAGLWFCVQRQRRPQPTQAVKSRSSMNRYSAVTIHVQSGACAAARALAGRHFLVHEAPELPLPACSGERCSCSFGKLSDRRVDNRRWADHGVTAQVFSADEKREQSDRRASTAARSR